MKNDLGTLIMSQRSTITYRFASTMLPLFSSQAGQQPGIGSFPNAGLHA